MHSPAWGWRRTTVMSAHGRQTAIGRGDATLMSSTEPSVTHIHTPSKFHCLALQRAKLAPLVSESWRGFRVGHSRQCRGRAAALALCGVAWRRYLAGDVGPAAACGLSCLRSCRAGARRDEGCRDDLASGRPARRPARSHQIGHRRTREGHLVLDRGGRQAPWPIAALYPAPVRGTGTTFTEYALEQRLQRAYRMLTDPRQDRHPIGSIALDAGFNDLSYLGATPRTFGPSPGTD